LTVFLKEKKSLHSKVNEDKKYTLKIPAPASLARRLYGCRSHFQQKLWLRPASLS
jgi:hypothetical protein